MLSVLFPRFRLLLAALVLAAVSLAADALTPEITSQGFDITETQGGLLGDFGRLRVRFEAPDRIEQLTVKERSYEVDLARTPETGHLPLFDLKTQVRQLTDVTLNLENYINQKADSEGLYTFEFRVTDRKGETASARLQIEVVSPPSAQEERTDEVVETSPFEITRIAAQHVAGAEAFGITWTTVESEGVVIKLTRSGDTGGKLVTIAPAAYAAITTGEELREALRNGTETSALRLETANGKAAGAVFGVINEGAPYLLSVTDSDASSSRQGTTVRLLGEYKH